MQLTIHRAIDGCRFRCRGGFNFAANAFEELKELAVSVGNALFPALLLQRISRYFQSALSALAAAVSTTVRR